MNEFDNFVSNKTENRIEAIKTRAEKLGVVGIFFSGQTKKDDLECLESAFDIIQEYDEIIKARAKAKMDKYRLKA
ncbi:MAG: hypothetical protein ACRCZB_04970 [Bacteroidales bacterium]